jgi:hypothetical protein
VAGVPGNAKKIAIAASHWESNPGPAFDAREMRDGFDARDVERSRVRSHRVRTVVIERKLLKGNA